MLAPVGLSAASMSPRMRCSCAGPSWVVGTRPWYIDDVPPAADARAVIERYFHAMRAGAAAQAELMALFAADARYTEPFTGVPRTHAGIAEIRACFIESWKAPPQDLQLTIDRIDVEGAHASAEWTCTSPAFPGPVRGRDEYEIADGKIPSLLVTFVEG